MRYIGICVVMALPANAQNLIGPQAYLELADSPFAGMAGLVVEDYEDGLFNTIGVTVNPGAEIVAPSAFTDSVDGDDGVVDGDGRDGYSFANANGAIGLTFTFDADELGGLPTAAGLVWTDGGGFTTFRAFDGDGVQIAEFTSAIADGSFAGTTAEDRFYGITFEGGIGSIAIANSRNAVESDHLQFVIPAPSTAVLLGLGLVMRRRRD